MSERGLFLIGLRRDGVRFFFLKIAWITMKLSIVTGTYSFIS
jgi:hypothetical protein